MSINGRMVPVTDHRGNFLLIGDDMEEPFPGSILMTEGQYGTAWQRHFVDGLWHSTRGGSPKRWDDIISKRNVVLVYDADEREVRTKAGVSA